MPVTKSLERLLRVFEIQEETRKRDLGEAQARLAKMEEALTTAGQKVDRGRMLLASALQLNELHNRVAGQVEIESGELHKAFLQKNVDEMSIIVEQARTGYLDKRVERQQVETLVETAERLAAAEEVRKAQQSLDDWFLNHPRNDQREDVSIDSEEQARRTDRIKTRASKAREL